MGDQFRRVVDNAQRTLAGILLDQAPDDQDPEHPRAADYVNSQSMAERVKLVGHGRWAEILPAITGASPEIFDGQSHACPKCGGKDRFRFGNWDGDGGIICSGGGTPCMQSGDGIGSVEALLDCNFAEAIEKLKAYLQIREHARGRSVKLKGDHSFLIEEWSTKQKPGTSVKSISRNNGQMFDVLDQGHDVKCIGFPVHNGAKLCGWIHYPLNGKPLHNKDGGEIKGAKLKFGTSPGWIGMRAMKLLLKGDVEVVFKCEGTTDMLALDNLLTSDKYVAITNHAGAGSVLPREQLELLRGKKVVIIADNDIAGRNGAKKYARALLGIPSKIIILVMPGEKEDIRQWITRQEGDDEAIRKRLFKMVRETPEFTHEVEDTVEVLLPGSTVVSKSLEPKTMNALAYAFVRLNCLLVRDKTAYLREGDKWIYISAEVLKGMVLRFLQLEAYRIHSEGGNHEGNKRLDVTPRIVDDVTRMAMMLRQAPHTLDFSCEMKHTRSLHAIECDGVRRNWLTMQNGILMLDKFIAREAEILKKPTSDWFSMVQLDFPFIEGHGGKERAFFIDFLERQIGDQEQIDALQEFLGYMLTQDLSIHQQTFLYIQGVANSGKSTLLAVIRALCGEGGYSGVGIDKFDDHAFMANTIGKMANITSETQQLGKLAENKIKMFVSGEPMVLRNLYERAYTACPTAKLIISSNFEPDFKDRSDGIWRRMLYIQMGRKIPDSEDRPGFTDPQYWVESGQMPAILNWALAGLDRLYERGRIVRPAASIRAIAEQKLNAHPELQFFDDHIEKSTGGHVFAKEMQETYNAWCKHHNARSSGSAWLGKRLKEHIETVERCREPGGTRQWFYTNVKLLRADYAHLQSGPGA